MSHWTSLISAGELAEHLDDCLLVDCRHDLAKPQAGAQAYEAGHLPGAHFLHLDRDLSGAVTGSNGRHPLPDPARLGAKLRALGLAAGRQLVAYDADTGMTAARLWWLAQWLGHHPVAVLDGGLAAWVRAGFPLTPGAAPPVDVPGASEAGETVAAPAPPGGQAPRIDAGALLANLQSPTLLVVDARAGERFRGEVEPIDARAGHIPGAINRPYDANLRDDGRFKPAPVLRAEFEALLAGRDPHTVVHSCGSGVSACHNLLAMAYAGLPGGILYPGSWSEWSADASRPIAQGEATRAG